LISLLKLLSQTGYKHRVIAVDPNASRRETVASILNNLTSRGLVASDVVKIVDTKDAVTTVEDAGEKIGCHAVLEVVGAPDALKLAYTLIRPFGVISSVGKSFIGLPISTSELNNFLAGIHTAPTFALIGSQLYDKNVSLNFGRCPARSLFNPAIEVLQWAGDPFTSVGKEYSLVDRVVGFDEATKSYEIFDKGECGKVIFDPWI
jgi:threonine dehydrogenase-like Zn-dependent dehydrogenase